MRTSNCAFLTGCIIVIMCSGCQKKEGDEPTKYRSQAKLERLSQQAAVTQSKGLKAVSNNQAFSNIRDAQGKASEVKDLDSVLRPVLKKLFKEAKIISESAKPETKMDKEVLENRFVYAVEKILVPKDGQTLHAALREANFGTSPRLGSKPTIWSGGAGMSLFKTTSKRSYSLVISVDTKKQQIVVESYKLGSKYDRLM